MTGFQSIQKRPIGIASTRDVSPIDDIILSRNAVYVNRGPILTVNDTVYREMSHTCEKYREASLDNLLEIRMDDQAYLQHFTTKVNADFCHFRINRYRPCDERLQSL